MSGTFDLDTWLDGYQPVVVEAKIVQKANLIAEHTRLQYEVMQARRSAADVMHDPEAARLEARLREVESEIGASEKTFTFQGIGHETWQNLKRQNPPTTAQRDMGDDVNLERWAPAVVAACSLDPKISPTQAEAMMRKLPPGEFDKLLISVREANQEVAGAPKSVLVALTERFRQNGGSLTTALPSESPDDDYSGTPDDQ